MNHSQDFIEIFKNFLDSILFHPGTPTELWVTLTVGVFVMLLLLFQLEIHFGAAQMNLPVALGSLIVGLAIMIGGSIAIKCYVFPILPENWASLLNESFANLTTVENLILAFVALILLFAAVCPITAALFHSSQFAAAWSWILALIAGIAVFFGVHAAFLHFKQSNKSTDALRQAVEQQREKLKSEEKY